MTKQIKDIIIAGDSKFEIEELPLDRCRNYLHNKSSFGTNSTACWRGYIATWEIVNAELYMVGLFSWKQYIDKINEKGDYDFMKAISEFKVFYENSLSKDNDTDVELFTEFMDNRKRELDDRSIKLLFPEVNNVFAKWYTGTITYNINDENKSERLGAIKKSVNEIVNGKLENSETIYFKDPNYY